MTEPETKRVVGVCVGIKGIESFRTTRPLLLTKTLYWIDYDLKQESLFGLT